jgi:hypothetical protein
MNKMLRKIFSVVVVSVLILGLQAMPAQAEEPEGIEEAIEAGLSYLIGQQNGDGSWGIGCDRVAKTALVVLKLNSYTIEMGEKPLLGDYKTEIKAGLDFIMDNSHDQPIGEEPAGDPDGDGDGIGVYFTDCDPSRKIYNTGIAMMALASSGDPDTYGDVLQDAVDFMAWAQADPACGLDRGGWRYNPEECTSDNSNSGYATLGLEYAQAPPPIWVWVDCPPVGEG